MRRLLSLVRCFDKTAIPIDPNEACYTHRMSKVLSLGQQLAALSLQARKRKLRTKKQWGDHMKKVRAAALDRRS